MNIQSVLLTNDYFSGSRLEVAALVPADIGSILGIGCGYGELGRALLPRGIEKIYGVEINPASVEYLKEIYDEFWIGNVESIKLPLSLQSLDCFVFADVLKNLVNLWATLEKYIQFLKPGDVVISSCNNVQKLELLYKLIFRGR